MSDEKKSLTVKNLSRLQFFVFLFASFSFMHFFLFFWLLEKCIRQEITFYDSKYMRDVRLQRLEIMQFLCFKIIDWGFLWLGLIQVLRTWKLGIPL